MNPRTEPESGSTGKKPRFALLLATGFGLGYLPRAPGTWGSLGGVALTRFLWQLLEPSVGPFIPWNTQILEGRNFQIALVLVLALASVGVWAAAQAQKLLGPTDPQQVVIDEISGQTLALVVGAWAGWNHPAGIWLLRSDTTHLFNLGTPNWKYLLLGFILFRVFDIWKPFPVRQAEKLPGGWGIMADDWVAGLYAALGLWLARALGLQG